ncbi:putative superfamily hydrolase [Anaeramoeba flamelloides]|uniref:Superfamily hydrolase n=1 Tax=Anaeramoeba flamelloides TaxID=1746091 RepID=A0AAV7ZRA9_9EUKA|nr:putative superfamily hydrolase [Anaeramoeba flamelloides]
MENYSTIISEVEEYCKQGYEEYDCSHDYEHCNRVRNHCLKIGSSYEDPIIEGMDKQKGFLILEISSLVHDLIDHKYGSVEQQTKKLEEFLNQRITKPEIEAIMTLINNISYSKQIKEKVPTNLGKLELARCILRDADRLDALGAMGVGRVFIYSTTRNPLTALKEARKHFDDKLFKLNNLIVTEPAKKIAQQLHDFMIQFCEQFDKEMNGGLWLKD